MCGLMKNPEVLVEFICEKLLLGYDPKKSEDRFDDSLIKCFRLLENLCKDIPEHGGKSHTKRFSYYCRYGIFEFNLSKLHDGFFGMIDTYVHSREKRSDEPAECAIFTDDLSSFSREELKRTLGQVGRGTKVVVSSLLVVSNNDANEKDAVNSAFTESIRFSKNPQVIFMKNCNWPHCVQDDISQKLRGCSEVQVVVLKSIRNISKALWVGLIRNKPLRVLQIEHCTLDGDELEPLFQELSQCKTLEVLSFAETEFTPYSRRSVAFLGTENIRYKWRTVGPLKALNLDGCNLPASELFDFLVKVTRSDLRMISLSGTKLTDGFSSLARLFSGRNLNSICLINAKLRNRDIKGLGEFLSATSLICRDWQSVNEKPRYLFLSQNTLTDLLSCLLGTQPAQYPLGLKFLWMGETQLGRNDLSTLEGAVRSGRLPELVSLDLSGNNLNMLQERLENLIVACTLQYTKTPLLVYLNDNSFSVEFQDSLKSKCQGTMVELSDEKPKFHFDTMITDVL